MDGDGTPSGSAPQDESPDTLARMSEGDLTRAPRLLITLGASAALIGLARVPLPLLAELQATFAQMLPGRANSLGLMALGLTPFVSAAVNVEALVALVPRWRHLRRSGEAARQRLWRRTVIVGLILASVQAFFVVHWMSSTAATLGPYGRLIPTGPTLVLVGAAMVIGSLVPLAIAALVTRRGLGNGFSIVLAVGLLDQQFGQVNSWFTQHGRVPSSLSGALLPELGVVAAMAWVQTWAVRPAESHRRVALPACGTAPLSLAFSCVALIGNLAQLGVNVGGLPGIFEPGSITSFAAMGSIVVLSGLALTWAFNRPQRLALYWSRAGHEKIDAQGALLAAMLRSTLLLLGLLAVIVFVSADRQPLDLLTAITVGAVIADGVTEWRARASGLHCLADSLHAPHVVAPVLAALEEAGIRAHARGLHHRTLLQFFGPYVPISIFVSAQDEDRARSVVQSVLG